MLNRNIIVFILISIFSQSLYADFRTTGWFNTFLPGGGKLINRDYSGAAQEASLETSTFALGYSLDHQGRFSLDGTNIVYQKSNGSNFETVNSNKELTAALFQEFGLKYHMMNVFLNYRDQFNKEGASDLGQGIDQRSSYEMFKDPFRPEVLTSAWVYLPVALTSAYVYFDFQSQKKVAVQPIRPLKTQSKIYNLFNQTILYPSGSAVPEEMFYRGFLQNEMYYTFRSPYFAVPMSSLFFALSHSQEYWPSAFVSGLYQGMLAYQNHGDLTYGNAVHFWGVFFLGLESYFLTLHSEAKAPPVALNFNFSY